MSTNLPAGNLTRDHILDNITLYWLTGTGASAARSYWEDGRAQAEALAAGQPPPEVSLPVGFTTFPGEIWRTPRSWVEKSYPNVVHFNEVDKAVTSPRGKSPSSSPPRCGLHSAHCASPYDRWVQSKAVQRALAFVSYCAALEREDPAARVYSMRVERVREGDA